MDGRERATLTPAELARYLQLPPPEAEDTERIRAFTAGLAKGEQNSYRASRKVEKFLKNNYRYTLSPRKGEGRTPLSDFLFYAKEGYCEQYATSMVVMLRTLGIPARVVTGYVQGQWNDFGNYLLIRQRDTHSWVEAYLPYDLSGGSAQARGRSGEKMAWIRFDPTASQGLAAQRENSRIALYIDSLKWRWTRHIVNYSLNDQVKAAITIRHSTGGLRRWLGSLLSKLPSLKRRASEDQTGPLVLALALMVSALIIVIINKGRNKNNVKTPEFYLEMLRALKKKGMVRSEFETPVEFARRAGREEVEQITELFQRRRYRGSALSAGELTELKRLITRLK